MTIKTFPYLAALAPLDGPTVNYDTPGVDIFTVYAPQDSAHTTWIEFEGPFADFTQAAAEDLLTRNGYALAEGATWSAYDPTPAEDNDPHGSDSGEREYETVVVQA